MGFVRKEERLKVADRQQELRWARQRNLYELFTPVLYDP